MLSFQGLIIFLGFIYLVYLSGKALKEEFNYARESYEIWKDERVKK